MKHLVWIILAMLLLLATVAIGALTDITDLRRAREWNITQAGQAGAELHGVHVRVAQVWAATAPSRPERAVIVVRLALRSNEAARQAWIGCDVSLSDGSGRVWRPLQTANTDGAIKAISPDGESKGRCTPVPYNAPPEGQEILSDQLFLVPADLLKGAKLRVSALGTRPDGLEFPITPAVRALQ
ncbi:hypothetical protein ATN84_22570 [Paramesorhizobium deserti]|uniref:DUF4352 domain-containing protein n=1 Tax=Paramesorhizobium deserti TaxID=1494590 RepID=A0A135HN95_9HYPH|nr:hypothetical protein [Paramesorhizobium deserti]KXF74682.1 hypothetical protein ATN84_22570 [Paramesorhizobium deserti]